MITFISPKVIPIYKDFDEATVIILIKDFYIIVMHFYWEIVN